LEDTSFAGSRGWKRSVVVIEKDEAVREEEEREDQEEQDFHHDASSKTEKTMTTEETMSEDSEFFLEAPAPADSLFEMLLDLESGTPDHTLLMNAAYTRKYKCIKKFVDKCIREKQISPRPKRSTYRGYRSIFTSRESFQSVSMSKHRVRGV
jgi:hypothetical protein